MKKKFKLFLFTFITAITATLTGCKDNFPTEPVTEPYLNLIPSATTVTLGAEGSLKVILDRVIPDKAVDITITSDNPALVITSTSLSITPESGNLSAVTTFKTNAVGEATVEISSNYPGIKYVTQSVKINIVKPQLRLTGAHFCKVGNDTTFAISSDLNVIEDVLIKLNSSDPAVTVPATLLLRKGTKTVSAKLTGASLGESTVTFTTSDKRVEIAKENNTGKLLNTLSVIVVNEPTLSLSGTKEAKVGDKPSFSISSNIPVEEDIILSIASSDPSVAEVPETITMTAGSSSASGNYTAKAIGSAIITISTDNTTVIIDDTGNSFETTVTEKPAEKK